jgi:hypothetical protein
MGYQELWWQFQPTDRPAGPSSGQGSTDAAGVVELETTVQRAVMAANQDMDDAGWGAEVFSEGVSGSERGPVALMSRTGTKDRVQAWFAALAQHLEDNGLGGKVTAAPQAYFPMWLDSGEVPPALTAFVAYQRVDVDPVSDPHSRTGWHVPPELTDHIAAAAVAWGRFDGAQVYLRRDIHTMRGTDPNVATPLAAGISRYALAGVSYLRSARPCRFVSANFAPHGHACYGESDQGRDREDRLQHVLAAMLAFPAQTDLAFVRYSGPYTASWSSIGSYGQRLPYVRYSKITANRHLYQRDTPDAHGIQILTDQHLANAHDLSDWIIEPLGDGRHLVQAADLTPWYAHPDIHPDTLAKARADFGPMILTPETIAANPPPAAPN